MIEAEQIMKRCQAGTRNYNEANNLHAACYGMIGKLLLKLKELESQEPVAWVDLQKEAQQIVKSKALWKKFIDGTPLANDIACWMTDFALQHTHPPQRTEPKVCDSFQARDVGMQPAECAGAIRARGDYSKALSSKNVSKY